jgi:hypothetical protein
MATPQDDIANFVEISDVTLRKHYASDLIRGKAEANLKVVQALFKNATRENNPNVVAQMFWLKNQAGWKDLPVAPPTSDDINVLRIEFADARPASYAADTSTTIDGTAEDRTAPTPHADEPRDEEQAEAPHEPPLSIAFAEPDVEPEPEDAAAQTSETPAARASVSTAAPASSHRPRPPGKYTWMR